MQSSMPGVQHCSSHFCMEQLSDLKIMAFEADTSAVVFHVRSKSSWLKGTFQHFEGDCRRWWENHFVLHDKAILMAKSTPNNVLGQQGERETNEL